MHKRKTESKSLCSSRELVHSGDSWCISRASAQARIHEAEDSMQAQHLLIEALVDEKDSLLQTIHGLQEANNAPAPFDGDWEEEPEEEPEEEEIEDIPLGERDR
ncbi:hypothetical protein F511_41565 [Dorcoceras hygrometricum]|uniref:Uncharacterized protein n=1 Tax=Dorcoceras hygrometricum TaxID=472368 RepID=A0A2Z7CFB3_9LAMI|nr:hypothetical protein F511_41565 [Dorcoceras hygrometricum]